MLSGGTSRISAAYRLLPASCALQAMIEKLLFIYRVWHNYVWVGTKTGGRRPLSGLGCREDKDQDTLYFDLRQELR